MGFSPERALALRHNTEGMDRVSRNPEERHMRFCTALHEAGHLMAAALYKEGVGGVCIPRPGKRPYGQRSAIGASGAIFVGGRSTVSEVVITLMGPVMELMIHGSPHTADSEGDWESLKPHYAHPTMARVDQYQLTPALESELTRRAETIAKGYAAEIDLAACALIDLSAQTGKVHHKKLQALYKWLAAKHERGEVRKQLDARPLFLSDIACLADRRKLRQQLDLSTKIEEKDFPKYGLTDPQRGELLPATPGDNLDNLMAELFD